MSLLTLQPSSFSRGDQITGRCRVRLTPLCNAVNVVQDCFNSCGPIRHGLLDRYSIGRCFFPHAAMLALSELAVCARAHTRTGSVTADRLRRMRRVNLLSLRAASDVAEVQRSGRQAALVV